MSSTATNDVSDLQTAAASVRAVAVEAQAASVVITVEMMLLKPWGADAIGRAFATAYLPGASSVMDAVLDTGPQLGQMADTLAASAGGYADTEQTNQGAAASVPTDPGVEV